MNAQTLNPLDACAEEPIRIPGGIQPHGALLVVEPQTLRPLQQSANLEAVLGQAFSEPQAVTSFLGEALTRQLREDRFEILHLPPGQGTDLQLSAHRTSQGLILEWELPTLDGAQSLDLFHLGLQNFADATMSAETLRALADLACIEVRAITGFNRVLFYSFDPDWHGTVIGEANDGALPSYLDLRFPASDIPAQARALYRLNPLRMIPRASYDPVPILPTISPVDGQPLDLSHSVLRSVSPVHLEYMRNMGTESSMSVSILVEGRLWGLISCHHATSRRISAAARGACNFVAKTAALQIASMERSAHAAGRIALKKHETELVARLSRARSVNEGLARNAASWLAITDAEGAAIVSGEGVDAVGLTPPVDAIRSLVQWLQKQDLRDVLATDQLSALWPGAEAFAETASGLIAASVSQLHPSYVMWFRPERVRTVTWGGDPRKPVLTGAERLHPRQSFALWKEQVHQRSRPWTRAEMESAEDFRNAVVNLVLRQAEEKAELTEELKRSNKELESFSYSISHDLRAPFRHIVGFAELLAAREPDLDDKSRHYLTSITEAALSAGQLVDDLLAFSHLGRANLGFSRVDMNKLVDEVQRSAGPDMAGRNIDWHIGRLPPAWGDGNLLRQVLTNLIDNAIKYSRGCNPAVITVTGEIRGNETVYAIVDNGVGFDMAYVGKLFGVFQRLHRAEEFEGTGIGLALTKRVVERHGGWIRAEGELGKGATFTFALPQRTREDKA